jgi:hypothetical protein
MPFDGDFCILQLQKWHPPVIASARIAIILRSLIIAFSHSLREYTENRKMQLTGHLNLLKSENFTQQK